MVLIPMKSGWALTATTGELVAMAREQNGVMDGQMTDDEIRVVMRWIGAALSNPAESPNGELPLNRTAVGIMLFVTMCEFPEFYGRNELSQYN